MPSYQEARREVKALRKALRKAKKSLAAARRYQLCICPQLLEHVAKELRQKLKLPEVRCNLMEEKWLSKRLDVWQVPTFDFAGLCF